METDRTHPTEFRGVTFWPRPVARDAPVDRDVLCESCGYNLRGLPGGADICPECGTKFDPKALRARDADQQRSQLPWKQRRAVGFIEGYYGSVRMVLLHPQKFHLEIWQGGRLGKKEASAFRWITIGHAYFPLLAIAIATIGPLLTARQFIPLAAVGAATLLAWLHATTRLPVNFFLRQTMAGDVQKRVVGLAHFACAALALSPIHLAMLAFAGGARSIEATQQPGMLVTAIVLVWAALIVIQILWWWASCIHLVHAAMRCDAGEMLMVSIIFIVFWTMQTGFYLGLVPFVAYQVLVKFVGL